MSACRRDCLPRKSSGRPSALRHARRTHTTSSMTGLNGISIDHLGIAVTSIDEALPSTSPYFCETKPFIGKSLKMRRLRR